MASKASAQKAAIKSSDFKPRGGQKNLLETTFILTVLLLLFGQCSAGYVAMNISKRYPRPLQTQEPLCYNGSVRYPCPALLVLLIAAAIFAAAFPPASHADTYQDYQNDITQAELAKEKGDGEGAFRNFLAA